MRRNIIIYFLHRKRDNADKLFYELVGKELLANNPTTRLVQSRMGHWAEFIDGTRIEMRYAAQNVRGLWWTTAYIDCDTDRHLIQEVLIPSGRGSKDIIYFN